MLNDKRRFYLDNANLNAKERREKFYREEADTFAKNHDFRPEEPNSRVYLRSIEAVVEADRQGLSPDDFRRMMEAFGDMHGLEPKKGGVR